MMKYFLASDRLSDVFKENTPHPRFIEIQLWKSQRNQNLNQHTAIFSLSVPKKTE